MDSAPLWLPVSARTSPAVHRPPLLKQRHKDIVAMKSCNRKSLSAILSLAPRISLALLLFSLAFASTNLPSQGADLFSPDQLKEEIASAPCKDTERLDAVRKLFERMGAAPADIAVERFKNVENLVISKPGLSSEKIVIGAHYDKVSDGCGAIDNWTGIVVLAHLYKSLKDAALNKTVLFVAFGKEEKGLFGSNAMAGAIPKDQLDHYCAMINIDSFGLAVPQVLDNVSNAKLRNLAADLAKEMKIPFSSASVNADADSSSFMKKKIPAVTLHGLSNEWASIIHTANDKPSRVNPMSVYLGYQLTLALATHLDRDPCGAYR